MKRDVRLHNVLFPVWMFYTPLGFALSPLLVGIILGGNFVWDSLMLLLAFACLRLPDKKRLYRRSILRVWLCGFAADVLAACPMLLWILRGGSEAYFTAWTLRDLPYLVPFVVLGGALVYGFNRFFALRKLDADRQTIHRIALLLAVLTAPYTFLIPSSLLYGGF